MDFCAVKAVPLLSIPMAILTSSLPEKEIDTLKIPPFLDSPR
jgi:hypothetical protein